MNVPGYQGTAWFWIIGLKLNAIKIDISIINKCFGSVPENCIYQSRSVHHKLIPHCLGLACTSGIIIELFVDEFNSSNNSRNEQHNGTCILG